MNRQTDRQTRLRQTDRPETEMHRGRDEQIDRQELGKQRHITKRETQRGREANTDELTQGIRTQNTLFFRASSSGSFKPNN